MPRTYPHRSCASRRRCRAIWLGGDVAIGQKPDRPIATQQTFDILQTKVAELKARHATVRQANAALIRATLERVFSVAD